MESIDAIWKFSIRTQLSALRGQIIGFNREKIRSKICSTISQDNYFTGFLILFAMPACGLLGEF